MNNGNKALLKVPRRPYCITETRVAAQLNKLYLTNCALLTNGNSLPTILIYEKNL